MDISLKTEFSLSTLKDIFPTTNLTSFRMRHLTYYLFLIPRSSGLSSRAFHLPFEAGFHEMRVQYLEKVPIPEIGKLDKKDLARLGESCTISAKQRFQLQSQVRHRILDLWPAPGSVDTRLS
jgi:hypothetical protein